MGDKKNLIAFNDMNNLLVLIAFSYIINVFIQIEYEIRITWLTLVYIDWNVKGE